MYACSVPIGSEELLAGLGTNACVTCLNDGITCKFDLADLSEDDGNYFFF